MRKLLPLVFVFMTTAVLGQVNWTKYPTPIIPRTMTYPDWNGLATADACVLLVNDTFKIWYSGAGWLPNDTLTHVSIGYAWSLNGVNWNQYSGNPVLQHSAQSNDPDFYGTETVNVVYDSLASSNERYRMWYSGKQDETAFSGSYKVCYATSPNGIQWTKYVGNPVLTAGDSTEWNNVMITNVSVLQDNGVFKLWFASPDVYFNNQSTDFKGNIGYATSTDGINWTKYPTPVLQAGVGGSPDSASVAEPCVLKIGNTYHMWYSMINSWTIENFAVGYAWSTDGINWTKSANNPVLPLGGAGAWDRYWAAHPGVVHDPQTQQLYMYYTGRDSTDFSSITSYTWDLGLATSPFVTGIDEVQAPEISIFPQPATDHVFIQTKEQFDRVRIYDMTGRLLYQENIRAQQRCSLAIDFLKTGIYMLQLETVEGNLRSRVLVVE